jgi:hypothetical protein
LLSGFCWTGAAEDGRAPTEEPVCFLLSGFCWTGGGTPAPTTILTCVYAEEGRSPEGLCGYWMRKGELTESPFWRVKLSFGRIEQLPRALTESEIRDLLAQAAQIKVSEIPRKGAALAKRNELTPSSRVSRTAKPRSRGPSFCDRYTRR